MKLIRLNVYTAALAAILLSGSASAGQADAGRKLPVTPVGSSPAETFARLERQGLTVIVVSRGRGLVTPPSMRGTQIEAGRLIDELAEFHGLRVVWRADGAVAVLYAPVSGEPGAIDSPAAARSAGWNRDVRAIPALIAAATGPNQELAWQASRALQRIGWAATLALGGEPAWDWRVAAADRAAYRGTGPMVHKEPDYLEFLDSASRCGPIAGERGRALLGEAAGHWHRRTRGYAILASARLVRADALPVLQKAAGDPSRQVRGCAAQAAGLAGAVEVLENMLADPCMATRYRVINALGVAGGEQSVALLEKTLADANPVLCRRALSALAEVGGQRAAAVIRGVADDASSDRQVRHHAVYCLGAVAGEQAMDVLAPLLSDADAGVRRAVAAALSRAGPKGLALLAKVIADPEDEVAIQALASIGRIGGAAAAALLEKALEHGDEYVRAAAVRALGEVGGELALTPLAKAQADRDSLVRAAATLALGQCGTVGALQSLQRAVSDKDIGVRADAAAALVNFNPANEQVWALLAQLANDADGYVRGKAVAAAAALGGPAALGVIRRSAEGSTGEVRRAAVMAMGLAVGPAGRGDIAPFLADADPQVRAAALEAAAECGGEEALQEVVKGLDRKQEAVVRLAAIRAAVRIGGVRAMAVLENAFSRPELPDDPAIAAVGEIGGVTGEQALAVLEKAIARSRKEWMNHCEVEAIGRLNSAPRERVLEHLGKFVLHDTSARARGDAARGLGHLGGAGIADLLHRAIALQDAVTKEKGAYSAREEVLSIIEAAAAAGAVDVLRAMLEWGLRSGGVNVQTGQAAMLELNDYSGRQDVPIIARILAVPHSTESPSININHSAADSLGRIGGAEARDALLNGLRNPKINGRVKASIMLALNDYFPGDVEAEKAMAGAAAK